MVLALHKTRRSDVPKPQRRPKQPAANSRLIAEPTVASESMSERQAAISASRLSKTFGRRIVLDAVDLEIMCGEAVALIGANGAGKTTLLGCLASLLRPSSGEVRWFGRLVGRDVALHRWIGMMGHQTGLYSHLTLRENLTLAARMTGVDDPKDRAEKWLDTIGLAPHASSPAAQLSRGMRQRAAVARALIHDPPLLLLDEPFTGLDVPSADWLLELLAERRDRGQTICFVTHDQNEIQRLAHRVLELHDGKVRDVTATHHENRRAHRAA